MNKLPRKSRLSLDRQTIRTLDKADLDQAAGGIYGYTCGNTMCQSCSYKSWVQKCSN